MAIEYKDKVAVITGSAHGLGFGFAQEIAKRGGKVVLADIAPTALKAAEAELKASGAECAACVMDVTVKEDWDKLLQFTLDTYGTPDMLFNNAGIMYNKNFPNMKIIDWEIYFKVNVFGMVMGVETFWPVMAEKGGYIVNTCSEASLGPCSDSNGIGMPYTPSKHAALAFSETLSIVFKERNIPIKVAAVMPGVVNTGIGRRIDDPETIPAEFADRYDQIKPSAPEDVAINEAVYAPFELPKDSKEYKDYMALAMGIEIDEAMRVIFEDLDAGYFYIYTHPRKARAAILQEAANRLRGYVQPQDVYNAWAEFGELSKFPY